MSAATASISPQVCSVIDAARAVIDRAVAAEPKAREGLAAQLACSLDTVERMRVSPIDARWTFARLKALERYECAVLRTDTIRAAILADELRPLGEATDAIAGISRDIGENAALIGRENAFLAAGAKDRSEALAIADQLDANGLHSLQASSAIRARVGGAA